MFLLVVAVIMMIYGTVKNDTVLLIVALAFAVAGYICPTADRVLTGDIFGQN